MAIRQRVIALVTNHMAHLRPITDRSVRRLANRLEPENIQGLCLVITADQFGRPPKPQIVSESVRALQAKAAELRVQSRAPKPILQGRHLCELGLKPGPEFGPILEAAFAAQLEGKFADLDQALAWLKRQEDLALPAEVLAALREGGH